MTKTAMQSPDNSGWEIDDKFLTDQEYQNMKRAYPGINWIEIVWEEPPPNQKQQQ